MRCGLCDACEIENIGCGCDGAYDDGCFLCTPERHERPACPPVAAGSKPLKEDDFGFFCPVCRLQVYVPTELTVGYSVWAKLPEGWILTHTHGEDGQWHCVCSEECAKKGLPPPWS